MNPLKFNKNEWFKDSECECKNCVDRNIHCISCEGRGFGFSCNRIRGEYYSGITHNYKGKIWVYKSDSLSTKYRKLRKMKENR